MESLVETTSSKGCQLLIIKRVHRGSILLVTLLEHPLLVTSILFIMHNAVIASAALAH